MGVNKATTSRTVLAVCVCVCVGECVCGTQRRLTGRQHERDKPFNIWLSTDRKTHTHTRMHTHTRAGRRVPVLIIRTLLLNLTLPLDRDSQRWKGGKRRGRERWRRADFCEDKEKDERCVSLADFLTPCMP